MLSSSSSGLDSLLGAAHMITTTTTTTIETTKIHSPVATRLAAAIAPMNVDDLPTLSPVAPNPVPIRSSSKYHHHRKSPMLSDAVSMFSYF